MMRSHTLYTNITNTTRYNFTVLGEANVHRIFTSLEMYTDYTFQILAFTVKGNGNFSESIVVRTDEDGKLKYIYQYCWDSINEYRVSLLNKSIP